MLVKLNVDQINHLKSTQFIGKWKNIPGIIKLAGRTVTFLFETEPGLESTVNFSLNKASKELLFDVEVPEPTHKLGDLVKVNDHRGGDSFFSVCVEVVDTGMWFVPRPYIVVEMKPSADGWKYRVNGDTAWLSGNRLLPYDNVRSFVSYNLT